MKYAYVIRHIAILSGHYIYSLLTAIATKLLYTNVDNIVHYYSLIFMSFKHDNLSILITFLMVDNEDHKRFT